jgi:hypothetical protein
MKKCTKCGEQKPLSEFYKDSLKLDKLRNSCKVCDRLKSHTWRKADPIKTRECWRASKLKKKYNITNEKYENMKTEQNNKCAICDNVLGFGHLSAIDHCHKTGMVRGLLCRGCNLLLGNAKDSTDILKSAILYLDKHAKKVKR